ncbi:MAG: sugar phosphate isomerase/epimerase, partial [Maribacter sp.]
MQEIKKVITRRNFTKLSATAIGCVPLMAFGSPIFNTVKKPKDELNISLFSKHLQFLDYNEMAAAAAKIGFNGVDLTVRPKGHVLPENVADDLPLAVAAIKKYGMNPGIMTTEVWDLKSAEQKKVLETASKLGFTHYRTGWLKYPDNVTLTESQAIYGQQAKTLEVLNKKLGLIGCYQNHAGKHVGAPIWDLPPILEVTKNEHMGAQYDIR